MTLAIKTCASCAKVCYPTERIRVSDLWVHKHCLKCSECSTTLSLNSVYVAASPSAPNTKLLYCARDVPKIVHTSVVDSVALKTAMRAPNPTTVPTGVMDGKKGKGKGKTIRFKGLTLRSKSIAAGLGAPKLDITGQRGNKVIVGQVGNVGLDSWDIAHAMSVQTQVSAPIRDHPAIHAQRTGTAASQWPMPSQPLEPQYTGQDCDIMSASKGEEEMAIENDLVKNLIRVFQLDSLDHIEVDQHDFSTPNPWTETCSDGLVVDIIGTAAGHDTGTWQGTLKPSFSRATAPSTIRTLRTLGSKKGTLTLARAKGNLRRPALSEVFNQPIEIDSGVVDERFMGTVSGNSVPQNTPMKGVSFNEDGTIRKKGGKDDDGDIGTIRAGKLIEALLPLSAHLVPLPFGSDDDLAEEGDDQTIEDAQRQLAADLETGGLELVMLFEEEPMLACEV